MMRTHFGWRLNDNKNCYHCGGKNYSWTFRDELYTDKRVYSILSCDCCGGLRLEVLNRRTERVLVKEISEQEAERLRLALEI